MSKVVTLHRLGIDVETRFKATLISRLRALKSTKQVGDGGEYHWDRNFSQVWLETEMTEDQLDDWLYATKGVNYVGTFKWGSHWPGEVA